MRIFIVLLLICVAMFTGCGTHNVGVELAQPHPLQVEWDGNWYPVDAWVPYQGVDVPVIHVPMYQGHWLAIPVLTPQVLALLAQAGVAESVDVIKSAVLEAYEAGQS